jgi:hypothetical protein
VTESNARPTSKKTSALTIILVVFLLGLAVATGILGYLYYTTRNQLTLLSTPEGQQTLAQQEVALTLSRLQKLTLLPEEEPIVATIIDAELLASQSEFYRNAQNGDQLVVFPQAQRAYIFSPSRNVIVNSGPLIVESESQPEATSSPEPIVSPSPAATPAPDPEASPAASESDS